MERFSAFKLFYNNFLYRNNVMIEYSKIDSSINKIIDVLKSSVNLYHDDKELYINNLTKYQSKLKKELDKIMDTYPYFFEKYYELYTRYVNSNDKVEDMPFVISCSFYNDYGYNSIDDDYIQRFSSIEKKRLRSKAKGVSFLEFYKMILEESNKDYFKGLVYKINEFLNVEVDIKKSFDQNKDIYIKDIKSLLSLNKRVLDKAKLSEDYNIIKDKMEFIYKDCFNDFGYKLEREIDKYLLYLYEVTSKNSNDFFDSIIVNDLDYNIYKDFVAKELKYKDKYDRLFEKNQVIVPNKINIAPSIRSNIIELYYDKRLYVKDLNDINKLIEILNGFKSLTVDIENHIWNYILFKASHTSYLGRNNNVRFAIINKLYEIYKPYDLLDRYEKNRLRVFDYITSNNDIMNQLDIKIKDYTRISGKEDILKRLLDKRKAFIIKNANKNIYSLSEDYDTRDYDLYYISNGLDVDTLVEIFNKLVGNNRIDSNKLVEFIAQCILLEKNNNYLVNKPDYEMISDMARNYLKREYNVGLDDVIYMSNRDKYNVLYDEFLANSMFNKLKGKYNIC